MHVVITSGGTSENLDGVRYITNFSTGSTGKVLAEYFLEKGSRVTLLHSRQSQLPALDFQDEKKLTCIPYTSFSDLNKQLEEVLSGKQTVDAVIHLAAVSDFSPEILELTDTKGHCYTTTPDTVGKISSDINRLTVIFKKNFKILDKIPEYCMSSGLYSNSNRPVIIGFKLTNTLSAEVQRKAVHALCLKGVCDLIVHNDLHAISPETGVHKAAVYASDGTLLSQTATKRELASTIFSLCSKQEKRSIK